MMRLTSLAKINLHLRVGAPEADGFHPLLSWFCTVGLCDTLELTATEAPGITLQCDRADVPTDATNLIVQAGQAILRHLPSPRGAAVTLQKRIPMGGGLGGGSSNAATALIGFNQIWNARLPMSRLHDLAAQLGSDVPFFLHGPSSVCTGHGENVTPIARPRPRWAVLFFSDFSMPTRQVYQQFDQKPRQGIQDHPLWPQWTNLPAPLLLLLLRNDLEEPAFELRPELATLRSDLERHLGQPVRMSGSGSTLFTLADEQEEAEEFAQLARLLCGNAVAVELAPVNPS